MRNEYYPNTFSQLKVGKMTLRNRIIATPEPDGRDPIGPDTFIRIM